MRLEDKKIAFGLKMAVLSGLIAYIVYTLSRQPADLGVIWLALAQAPNPFFWVSLLLLLTPVNWGFEALKWQGLVRRVEPISFADAYRGVLAGLALSMAIPTGVGDTVGRVLSLRSTRRADSIGAALVSGGMQFYVAICLGAPAWTLYIDRVPQRDGTAARALAIGLWTLVGLGVLLANIRPMLLRWSGHVPFLNRFSAYWAVAAQYTGRELLTAFGSATGRYLTFSVQFLLVLHLYGLSLPPADLLAGIGLVFLVKTITPAFNWLSDLGVREAEALWVFAPYNLPAPLLIAATLTLWIVNVLAPVLVGLVGVWRIRLAGTRTT